MNIFRLVGDMTRLFLVLLLLKIYATKSCSGISVKTQELYVFVFVTRYLDLFTDFISVYKTVLKLVFIGSSLAIVWCIWRHRMVRHTYDKDLDTFRHFFLVLAAFVLALLVHEKFTFLELILLQRSGNVDNLTGQYIFFLGRPRGAEHLSIWQLQFSFCTALKWAQPAFRVFGAYRAFYILNWIYRHFTEPCITRWIACFSGLVQAALYADFFYYYFISGKNNAKLTLPA